MKKEIQSVKDFFNDAMEFMHKSFSNLLSRFSGKKITVETEVKGAERIEQAKQKLESLPKTKTVKVKVEKNGELSGLSSLTGKTDTSGMGQAVKQLPDPPVTLWSKMKGVFSSLYSGLKNFAGGLKEVTGYLVSSGGGALILIEGFKSLVKIGQHFYNSWIDGMKEAAAMSEQNAGSIREAAEANEALRQKGDAYLSQLEQISSQESLSNTNKAEAKKILGELTKAYGDLGIKLDETTGKLTGVDSAMIKKAEKDKSQRIKALEAELREIQNENEQQAALRDKAGIPVWFGGNARLGGKDTILAAGKKIEENNKRAGEIRRQLHEERKKDPRGEITRKREAEVADLEARNREQQRAFEQRKADDAFADARDPAEKIRNRQEQLDRHRKEKLDPLEKQVEAARAAVQNSSSDVDRLEAQRNLSHLEKALQAEREKAYVWERQIAGIQKQQTDELSKQQQEREALLRKQKQEKEEKAAALKSGLRDKAQELKSQAMEKAGLGQEAAREKALRDAEKTKGGKLTDEEAGMVKKLSDLNWNLDNRREAQFGDLAIQTNSLTARGGFQGGAVVPDAEKYNRIIADNGKTMLSVVQRIETICRQFGNF